MTGMASAHTASVLYAGPLLHVASRACSVLSSRMPADSSSARDDRQKVGTTPADWKLFSTLAHP